jgi:hypothetical protein
MSAFPPYPADGIAEIGGRGFDFGSLRFDDGERLSPKAAHVLWLLVQAAGRTLEKDTLLDHAWAGQPRVPDVLVQAVGEIRRGLGDSDRRGLVLTVPKIGYRLQAEVHWRIAPGARPRLHGEWRRSRLACCFSPPCLASSCCGCGRPRHHQLRWWNRLFRLDGDCPASSG